MPHIEDHFHHIYLQREVICGGFQVLTSLQFYCSQLVRFWGIVWIWKRNRGMRERRHPANGLRLGIKPRTTALNTTDCTWCACAPSERRRPLSLSPLYNFELQHIILSQLKWYCSCAKCLAKKVNEAFMEGCLYRNLAIKLAGKLLILVRL